MKFTVEYKGQPIEVDIPEETLKMMAKDQKKKTGWEKPERGQWYWYIDHQSIVQRSCWSNENVDLVRYDFGNCFTSKELAENIARYTSLDRRIRRRIAEICEPIDWNNTRTKKYGLYYHHDDRKPCVYECNWGQYCSWHCDTKAHAEQIIEEFKDELTWYFTEFKDRMDS